MIDPAPAGSLETGESRLAIRLSPPGSWANFGSVPTNPRRLAGSGTIEFTAESVILRAKRQRPFLPGASAEITIPREAIRNVIARGEQVIFTEEGAAQPWTLFAGSDAAAQDLLARLPIGRSPEFEAAQATVADFERRLGEIAPKVRVTPVLIALNVLVFVAMAIAGAGVLAPKPAVHIAWGSNFGPATMTGEGWRLLSSTFIHFGFVHLFFNMFALMANGPRVELLLGSARFAVLYLLAGIAGSATSVLWNPAVNSAGASGAIFGVLGAMVALALRKDLQVPTAFMTAQRNSALVFIAYNLANGLRGAGIDNAAHIGGLLAGFVLAFALAQPIDAAARRTASPAARYAMPALAVGLVLALGIRALYPDPTLRHVQLLRLDFAWLLNAEPAIQRTTNHAIDAAERNPADRAAQLARIEREVLPFYAEATRRFASKAPLGEVSFESDRRWTRRLLEQRNVANGRLVRWLRSGSSADRAAYRREEDRFALLVAERRGGEATLERLPPGARPPGEFSAHAELQRLMTIDSFHEDVKALDAAEEAIRHAHHAGELTDQQAAERFEQEIVPRWEALETKLDAESNGDRLPTERIARARRDVLTRSRTVVDVRADAWRKGTPELREWASELERRRNAHRRDVGWEVIALD